MHTIIVLETIPRQFLGPASLKYFGAYGGNMNEKLV